MKVAPKSLLAVASLSLLTAMSLSTHAQTLTKNNDWLEKQLNRLVVADSKSTDNAKKSTPKFDFEQCQLGMKVDDKDEESSLGMNLTWRLKDIKKVSYRQEKNGQYTLVIDAPTDHVKMNLGGLSVSLGSNEAGRKRSNGKENNTNSFTLSTKEESVVKQIKQRFDESIQLCQKSTN